MTVRGREAPSADETAEGRAVVARRVDALYLVERHGMFVRHGARARACCNDAPLSQRHATKLLLFFFAERPANYD